MNRQNQATASLIQDAHQASAVLHPLRRQILECLRQPDSASGLARRLGLPRQKINYHLRALEKQGLVQFVQERRKGNCVERIVRATARCYLINPELLGSLATDPDQIQDRFSSSYLVAVSARAIRDLALLRSRAEKAKKRLATLALHGEIRFASASDRNAFAEELTREAARLIAKYHNEQSPDGRRFRFFVGCYPTSAKQSEEEHSSEEKHDSTGIEVRDAED